MRPRILIILLSVLVTLGIIAGLIYRQQQEPTAQPATSSPVATAPVAVPMPAASESPGTQTNTAAAASPDAPVDLTMDASGLSKTTAVIETSNGKIKFKFYPKEAPNTVARLIELIKQGFYNGLTFHRVVKGFVVQGGDPKGDGTGGSGKNLKAEFSERRHAEGTLAMARAKDPDSADSQFYIALGAQPHLDRSYTIFGQVIEGMDNVKKIQIGDKMIKITLE